MSIHDHTLPETIRVAMMMLCDPDLKGFELFAANGLGVASLGVVPDEEDAALGLMAYQIKRVDVFREMLDPEERAEMDKVVAATRIVAEASE
jgi:hypothetical protein